MSEFIKHYEFEVIELMGVDNDSIEHCGSCHSEEDYGIEMPEYDIAEFGEE